MNKSNIANNLNTTAAGYALDARAAKAIIDIIDNRYSKGIQSDNYSGFYKIRLNWNGGSPYLELYKNENTRYGYIYFTAG